LGRAPERRFTAITACFAVAARSGLLPLWLCLIAAPMHCTFFSNKRRREDGPASGTGKASGGKK
jgi:hypothetical protein